MRYTCSPTSSAPARDDRCPTKGALGMSVKVMTWVWDHSRSTGMERLVLLAIADSADHDGTNSWPSVSTLAAKTMVSDRTVRRSIRALEALGELLVEVQAGGLASTPEYLRPNLYTVLVNGGSDCHPLSSVTPVRSVSGGQTALVRGGQAVPQSVLKEEPSKTARASASPVDEPRLSADRLAEITSPARQRTATARRHSLR